MRRTTSISLSSEEEAFMRRQMEIAGETELGPHIKRVYFGRLNPSEGVLAQLMKNSDMALTMLATVAKDRGESPAKDESRDLELQLLAAIFTMLHMSIGKDQRLMIERYIDPKAVENFLKAGGAV
ncbi:hypothetical protein [Burkholderia multivorans]|uniref:hypothetical protein n=1 Tax=Burkholderia multivorans TaxID=87883 RepID=UPI00057ED00B|nr:hypothetical protein [Burkholderia multivorans]KHS09435.1 hypothetical protein BMD20_29655 [Burkholderia multivorans]KHS10368.1 hypothetical protein BMD22_28170 [Burkholderia multivorans]MDR9230062.1 hypothetical protein [Burkholderia multivorans]HDR9474428.1 hypothetical protein [Burkholderia multivorans]HDR9480270.1 hypothetical protein [Burkholderia multivorans]